VILAPKALIEIAVLVGEVSTRILNLLDRLVKAVRRLSGQLELGSGLLKQIEEALEGAATLRTTRVAGALLSDGAGVVSKLGTAWRMAGGGQGLSGVSGFVKGSAAGGLLENYAQEAGKASDQLRKESDRAGRVLREQQQQAVPVNEG
jgi:hypothetical protein